MSASVSSTPEDGTPEEAALERATLRKVYLRVVPFCFVLYILCYVDRINVSFAALTMNRDLGLSAYVYGLAAGAFFWGYCLLEVPSNIILEKVGARLWIARIMISWGLLSAATALVTGPTSFFVVRVLVGVAEAGLFPGLLLYFHRWFPQHHRGRVVGWFLTGLPLATAIGAPVSTAFLQMDGIWGLHGWQWMFVGEGLPTALIGISVLFFLTERPSEARWLAPEQRAWLDNALRRETHAIELVRSHSILSAMTNPRVLILTVIFGGIGMAGVGTVLFLPQILKAIGVSNTQAGLLTSVPYVFGTVAIVVCGHLSDKVADRYWTLVVTCGLATIGMILAAMLHDSLWVLAAFAVATIGFYGMKSPFWPLPSTFLTGSALAAGLALINSLGNFAGYLGPIVVGYAKDATGSFEAGLYALAAAAFVATMTALGCALWMPRGAVALTRLVPARR
ncbi:MAG: transporter, family, tartrate transporter [Acetobacteraceae bacterium]|nr:transporter, family, tartrate transporter [Acetobacteraceae bacterium]